jgi:hypothetical protein
MPNEDVNYLFVTGETVYVDLHKVKKTVLLKTQTKIDFFVLNTTRSANRSCSLSEDSSASLQTGVSPQRVGV